MTRPTIRYYTDENIPAAVAEQLQRRGIDVIRCPDVGLLGEDDVTQLEFAVREGRVIVTWDADFLRLHAAWMQERRDHPGIVYVTPNHRPEIGVMVTELVHLHETVTPETMVNRVHYI